MGCSPAIAFAVAPPEATGSVILYWPVGGVHYRLDSHGRFGEHVAYVQQHGLAGVVELVTAEGKAFNQDPRGGPWATVIRRDPEFARAYLQLDVDGYLALVRGTAQALFDRDTAPGAEPEALLRLRTPALIVPGRDKTHATSAARYLEECLPAAEYWDIPVTEQTEATVPLRLIRFLDDHPISPRVLG
jgi:hypothetical protein